MAEIKKFSWQTRVCPLLSAQKIATSPEAQPCLGSQCMLFCHDAEGKGDGACAIAVLPLVVSNQGNAIGALVNMIAQANAGPAPKSKIIPHQ